MKKNFVTLRTLRLESLESRQMLSATPYDVPVASESVALVAPIELFNTIVDPNPVAGDEEVASTGDLTFAAGETIGAYTISWDAIEGAEYYVIRALRTDDNGESVWKTCGKTTDGADEDTSVDPTRTTFDLKGLYVGKEYAFQVCGIYTSDRGTPKFVNDDSGARVTREGTFAPVSIASNRLTYAPTEEIDLTLRGASSASADVRWYLLTSEGDSEIEAASSLLSYQPTLEEANYDIKVVATGTGVSEGSSKTLVFRARGDFTSTYDMTTRCATVSWAPTENAASYKLRIWRPETELTRELDDGSLETYTRPAGYIDYANVTEPICVVNGLYAGNGDAHIYKIRVIAYDAEGQTAGYYAGSLAPISVCASKEVYKAGEEIQVVVKTAGQYSDLDWYVTEHSGSESQTILADTAGDEALEQISMSTEYTTTTDAQDQKIKILVTGSGLAGGMTAAVVVDVVESQLKFGDFAPYDTVNRSITTSWGQVDGAVSYRFLKQGLDQNGNIIWKKAAAIAVENGCVTSGDAEIVDGQIVYTVKMFDAGVEGLYRVVAADENGTIIEDQTASYTNFGLELDHDAYGLAGDVLEARTVPSTGATYQWYVSEDQGSIWSLIDGATDASYTISENAAQTRSFYKLVATNEATGAESVVYAKPETVGNPKGLDVSVADGDVLNLTFRAVEGAQEYQVEYFNTDSANPVWINMTQVTYTETGDGHVVATHVKGEKYSGYEIRVRALTDEGWSQWNGPVTVAAPEIGGVVYRPATADAPENITVDWTHAGDVDKYVVTVTATDTDGVSSSQTYELAADATSFVYDGPIGSDLVYEFNVSAVADDVIASDSATYALANATISPDSNVNPGTTVTAILSNSSADADFNWYLYNSTTRQYELVGTGESYTIPANALPTYTKVRLETVGKGVSEGSGSVVSVDITKAQRIIAVDTLADNTNPYDGKLSLREALATAEDGDRIVFSSDLRGGTITLSSTLTIPKNVVIDASALVDPTTGANGVTISGNNQVRHFNVGNHEAEFVSINLINGNKSDEGGKGGSFYVNRGTLTLDDCVFDNNRSADQGSVIYDGGYSTITLTNSSVSHSNTAQGAIYTNAGSVVTVDGCSFSDNQSPNRGGVFHAGGASVTISNSEFLRNTSSESGSAVAAYAQNVTITSTTFDDNDSTNQGGAIWISSSSNVEIDDCTIVNSNSQEGAVYNAGGALTIKNSELSNNVGTNNGGAVASMQGNVTIVDSKIMGNTAGQTGAGLYIQGSWSGVTSNLTITNSVLSGNVANGGGAQGGAINCNVNQLTITNSLIDNNKASVGAAIACNQSPLTMYNTTITANRNTDSWANSVVAGGTVRVYNSIIAGNVNNQDFTGYGDKKAYGVVSSFTGWDYGSADVISYNANRTLFMNAVTRDFRPANNSQALDAGLNQYVPSGLTSDLAGEQRIVNTVDLGAYEKQTQWNALLDEAFADLFDELDD